MSDLLKEIARFLYIAIGFDFFTSLIISFEAPEEIIFILKIGYYVILSIYLIKVYPLIAENLKLSIELKKKKKKDKQS